MMFLSCEVLPGESPTVACHHQDVLCCHFASVLRTFAPIATAHFFAHVTHTSCIADHKGKHDAEGANIIQQEWNVKACGIMG